MYSWPAQAGSYLTSVWVRSPSEGLARELRRFLGWMGESSGGGSRGSREGEGGLPTQLFRRNRIRLAGGEGRGEAPRKRFRCLVKEAFVSFPLFHQLALRQGKAGGSPVGAENKK